MSPFFWVGVLAAAAAVTAGISLILTLRAGSPLDLRSKVRALDSDLTDLIDRVEHWRGRDAVRKMRAGQEFAAAAQLPQRGTPEYKAMLRARVRGINEPSQAERR